MAMSRKDFIALADVIRRYNAESFPSGGNTVSPLQFTHTQLQSLADFCQQQNPMFKRGRWFAYINGECGPKRGAIKVPSGPLAAEKASTPDVRIQNEGSILIFYAMTDAAKQWIADHLPEDIQTWGVNGVVIEHRYAPEIAYAMQQDGLLITG